MSAIMRKPKQRSFTTIDNYLIDDVNLKPESKGFLIFMLSKPDNWQFSFSYLMKALGVGEKSVRSNLKKLEELKYLKRERINDSTGKYVWVYNIYEMPYDLEIIKENSPYILKGDVLMGNIYQYYNKSNYIDKIDKTKNIQNNSIFTDELIKLGFISDDDINIKYYNNLFNEYLMNDYSNSDIYTVIHYIVSKVKDNDYKDENGNEIKNKYGYFKNAFESNFRRFNKQNELLEYDWLNDIEK